MFRSFIQSHLFMAILKGAVTGAVSAAAVDYQAFKSWKSFHDVATYNWSTAAFRWGQGAFLGATSAVSFGIF